MSGDEFLVWVRESFSVQNDRLVVDVAPLRHVCLTREQADFLVGHLRCLLVALPGRRGGV